MRIKVFVSYTSELKDFKDVVFDECNKVNSDLSDKSDISLIAVDWNICREISSGPRIQSLINKCLHDCQIFVGILWKRFGTPPAELNPLTGKEYESGMQEEFEEAIKYQKNGLITPLFFFNTSPPADKKLSRDKQLKKVLDYKKNLEERKIAYFTVDSKDSFRSEIYRKLRNYAEIQANKQKIKRIKNIASLARYEQPEEYLSRKVVEYKDYVSKESKYILNMLGKDLVDVIKTNNRIALLADAQFGKSIELRRIANHFSSEDKNHFPFYVSLNIYTNESIEELLPDYWQEIPEESLIVLLDGLDEIEAQYRNTAHRKIEKFSLKHPNCKMVVSCRTNFFVSSTDESAGTLNQFKAFVLTELSMEDADAYMGLKLHNLKADFIDKLCLTRAIHLIGNPFYLQFLVGKYLKTNTLPDSRSELYDELIKQKLLTDKEHFRNVRENEDIYEEEMVLKELSRIAIAMEIFGKNYISIEELKNIGVNNNFFQIFSYKSIFKVERDCYQFEHNSFQEYLAAKTLANENLPTLQKILSFAPHYKVIIPSWVNTLSFLLNIYPTDDLKNWLLNIQPELIIKFEPMRVEKELKIQIFQKIVNDYNKKNIWISREKYDLKELARFGECIENINFLLKIIQEDKHYINTGNAINLFAFFQEIPIDVKTKSRNLLKTIALHHDKVEIRNDAILALGIQNLLNNSIINILLKKYSDSQNDWIRYAMYFILESPPLVDNHIHFFLSGIELIKKDFSVSNSTESRLGNESWHLMTGLENAKTAKSIRVILDYLIDNSDTVHMIGFEKTFSIIIENAAKAQRASQNDEIFERICRLYLILERRYLTEVKFCIEFFKKSNTQLKAFHYVLKEINHKGEKNNLMVSLAKIATKESFDSILRGYETEKYNENEIWVFQSYLSSSLYDSFNKKINSISNNKFIPPPKRDFKKQQERRDKKETALFFDKTLLLNEVINFFVSENLYEIDKKKINEIKYDYSRENDYPNLLIEFIYDQVEKGPLTQKQIVKNIGEINWYNTSILHLYNELIYNKKRDLDTKQVMALEKWCLEKLDDVDFRSAIKIENNSHTSDRTAAIIFTFFFHYNINLPKESIIGMLSYNWNGIGITHLEKYLAPEEIKNHVCLIFREKDYINDITLRNYLYLCKKYQIKDTWRFIEKEIQNQSRAIELREYALDIADSFNIPSRKLLYILKKVTGEIKWPIIDLLIKRNSNTAANFLLKQLKANNNEDRLKASFQLMRVKKIAGVQFYTNKLKREKTFISIPGLKFLINFNKSSAIPYLITLLELHYRKDFHQTDRFETLDKVVESSLTNISMTSERNFKKVCNAIQKFIKENIQKYEHVHFLYSYLERLERQFYFNKGQRKTLDDVKRLLSFLKI